MCMLIYTIDACDRFHLQEKIELFVYEFGESFWVLLAK
jgi:hypothetical protein